MATAAAEISRGSGVGVEAPRRYVVDIEDTDIDTHVGIWDGQLAGISTMAVNDDRVDLRVHLRNAHWRGAERLIGIASYSVAGDGGRLRFSCIDSALHADPSGVATVVAPPCLNERNGASR